jgi:hypothetical protein
LGAPSPAENDVRQRAVFGAKYGLNRATLDAQKVRKINDFAISGLLAADQKVRSSNLFGCAIFSALSPSLAPTSLQTIKKHSFECW